MDVRKIVRGFPVVVNMCGYISLLAGIENVTSGQCLCLEGFY